MTANMPNFAIPGKPEYDGENRTNLKTFGKWHIPFFTDEKAATTQKNEPVKPAAVAPPAKPKEEAKPPALVTIANKTKNETQAVA